MKRNRYGAAVRAAIAYGRRPTFEGGGGAADDSASTDDAAAAAAAAAAAEAAAAEAAERERVKALQDLAAGARQRLGLAKALPELRAAGADLGLRDSAQQELQRWLARAFEVDAAGQVVSRADNGRVPAGMTPRHAVEYLAGSRPHWFADPASQRFAVRTAPIDAPVPTRDYFARLLRS